MKQSHQCVLFVDDDRATNFFNKRIASNHGSFRTIVTAQSGMEALEYLRTYQKGAAAKPDLIFLDINMPAMTGWEFLRVTILHNQHRHVKQYPTMHYFGIPM